MTTVHSLQVIDDDLPETDHDFSVDLIVTPEEVIACGPPRRPVGIIWDDMPPEKIAAIPVLAALRKQHGALLDCPWHLRRTWGRRAMD